MHWRQYHGLKRGRSGKKVPPIDFSCSPPTHPWTLGGWNTNDGSNDNNTVKKYNNYEYQPNNQSHLVLAPTHGGARRGRSAARGSGPVRPGNSVQDFVGQDFVTDFEDSSS